MNNKSINTSPTWGTNTKLIVGLTLVALTAGFLIRFKALIPPLLLTLVLIYLLYPVIDRLSSTTRLSWRWSVIIVFFLLVVFSITAITLTGVAVVQQFQSLLKIIQGFISDLPEIVSGFSTRIFTIGPFQLDMSQYLDTSNIESILQDILGLVQPVIGRTGSLLGTIASGTATTLGWVFFILILSYFILADAGHLPHSVVNIEIPGYDSDIRRIFRELSRIWNAFLRGQIIMFTFSVLIYTFLFTVLGVRYVLALALVSGLARFVPYIGQWVNWAVLILVLVFQKSNYFGLGTMQYVILVAAIVFVVDQVLDNIVSPRILGRSIGVHPAGVLIAALVGFSLLGIVGVILAAPGLASVTMLGGYIGRKMLDLDPWPKSEPDQPALQYPWMRWGNQIWIWMKDFRDWFIRKYRSGN